MEPLLDRKTLEFVLGLLHTFSVRLKSPTPSELRKLRALAENPLEESLPDDELACAIVHRERNRRAESSVPYRTLWAA